LGAGDAVGAWFGWVGFDVWRNQAVDGLGCVLEQNNVAGSAIENDLPLFAKNISGFPVYRNSSAVQDPVAVVFCNVIDVGVDERPREF